MELLVVSKKWCRDCVDVKNYLNDHNVTFIEFNTSDLEFIEVGGTPHTVETLGAVSVPLTILFKGEKEVGRVAGNDQKALQALVDQL